MIRAARAQRERVVDRDDAEQRRLRRADLHVDGGRFARLALRCHDELVPAALVHAEQSLDAEVRVRARRRPRAALFWCRSGRCGNQPVS